MKRKATILINKEILDILNEDELKAIIVHELAHIKYDLRIIALLKFFSRIALFPNYYLLLLMNYREMEFNADRVAIKMMRNSVALEKALKKLTFSKYLFAREEKPLKSKLPGWIYNFRKWKSIFNDFFVRNTLVGYTHPSILDRIKSIEESG